MVTALAVERAVVITGIGGQGIQLIAKLLAQGAIRDGRQVMTFGVFMGTIRGGSSESTVVIADDEIVAPPIVPSAWAVVSMHPDGMAGAVRKLESGGVLLVNSSLVTAPFDRDDVRRIALPATDIAKAMGQVMVAGMVALGAFAGATGIVDVASLQAALADVLPPHRRKLIEANRDAIVRGAESVAREDATSGARAWA